MLIPYRAGIEPWCLNSAWVISEMLTNLLRSTNLSGVFMQLELRVGDLWFGYAIEEIRKQWSVSLNCLLIGKWYWYLVSV